MVCFEYKEQPIFPEINWKECETAYLEWEQADPLNRGYYFKLLKEAVQAEKINFESITNKKGFSVYRGLNCIEEKSAVFMYSSPFWMDSPLFSNEAIKIWYLICSKKDPNLISLGYNEISKKDLPTNLKECASIFPDWETNDAIVIRCCSYQEN